MRNRGGFTIVETMIVLGVTGVLLFIAVSSFSGKQGRIEFAQSMREIDARVKDSLNDVNNGFYPTVAKLKCEVTDGSSQPRLSIDAVDDTTGRNGDCVAAGKVIQFGTDEELTDTITYTMAGRRTITVGSLTRDVNNISELKPVVIYDVRSGGPGVLDASEHDTLPSGIHLVKSDGTTDSRVAIGIYYQNFGGQSNGQSAGAASVSIANLSPLISSYTQDNVVAAAESIDNDNDFLPANGSLLLCFKSVTSNQFSTLSITGARGGFTTELNVDVRLAGLPCE